MLASRDCARAATGDASRGWSGHSPASPGESKESFSAQCFPVLPSLVNAAIPPIFMQHLARNVALVAKLQEEVTRVKAAAVMARAHTAQVEGMA
jgi:hypothetical protein